MDVGKVLARRFSICRDISDVGVLSLPVKFSRSFRFALRSNENAQEGSILQGRRSLKRSFTFCQGFYDKNPQVGFTVSPEPG